MRTILCSSALAGSLLVLGATPANAQLDLPRPSPGAKVMQQVGLTDITVDYSCPGVKKRKIWGAVVPFDKIWRTGANASTKVTFSKEVTVGTAKVPAGTYSLLTIPTAKTWTLILNKNTDLGGNVDKYSQDQDVARVTATPKVAPHRERLTFLFSDASDDAVSLDLEWEKVHVSLPIKTHTDEQAKANIERTLNNTWRTYANAARFVMERKDYDAALKYIEQSLALKEDWLNVWTKAQVLAGKGEKEQAHTLAEKANQLGSKNPAGFFYAEDVKKALVEWKKK